MLGCANPPHLAHRLDGTDVVVHMVHRHEHRLWRDGRLKFVQTNHPLRSHADSGAGPTLLFEELHRVHDARVLSG